MGGLRRIISGLVVTPFAITLSDLVPAHLIFNAHPHPILVQSQAGRKLICNRSKRDRSVLIAGFASRPSCEFVPGTGGSSNSEGNSAELSARLGERTDEKEPYIHVQRWKFTVSCEFTSFLTTDVDTGCGVFMGSTPNDLRSNRQCAKQLHLIHKHRDLGKKGNRNETQRMVTPEKCG